MNEVLGVVGGLMTLLFFCVFYAQFFMREMSQDVPDDLVKNLGLVFFLLSVFFANLLMYAILLIAGQASLTYLSDSLLLIGLQAVMWATLGSFALYVLYLTFKGLVFLVEVIRGFMRGSRRNRQKAGRRRWT